jgi:PAS domain S-box-containing protein
VTFARRLVLGTIVVLVLTTLVLAWTAERSLRRDLESDVVRTLEREVRLVARALPPDTAQWTGLITRIARENENRITLVDRSGRVVADSDVRSDSVRFLENHAGRPEIRAALAGRRGLDRRRSESVDRELFYVALPGGPGVVRVAERPVAVDAIMDRAREAILGSALLALVLGGVLAFVAGRSIARPLTALASTARAIAAGAPPRFPRSGIPDIDALVQALRQMHQQLADRFAELRHEQAESAALVESMVEGVIAADARGRIVTANSAARRLLGYGQDEPLPGLAELFRVKAAREIVQAVLAGQLVQNRQLEMDGRVLIASARPLPGGGAVLVLHDLTELRRLEAVRRDFVANVSHELKTPLTSISGYAETLLADRPGPEVERRFLATILSNARRMQRLVDDLLDLSRIESGRWQPDLGPVDVATTAREAWAGLSERAKERGVRLEVDVAPDAATVQADDDALCQALTNLFDNALRYSAPGTAIVCRARPEGEGVTVSVTDQGAGISREHLPRIFERFYRADPSRSRAEGGTGLGLSIVKHVVEAHGGRVSAESQLGAGTTVSCWFPNA